MTKYEHPGVYNTTATDGRAVEIIFLHGEQYRTEQDIIDTVHVLRSFAAAANRGELVRI